MSRADLSRKKKEAAIEIIQSVKQKDKRIKKNHESLRDMWDTTKVINICTTGVPNKRRESNRRIFHQITAKTFPSLIQEI